MSHPLCVRGEVPVDCYYGDLCRSSAADCYPCFGFFFGTADRPWETPNGEDMSALPQLEVQGPSGFDAVVGSLKAKTGIGVDARFIPQCGRASQKGCEQVYTDLTPNGEDMSVLPRLEVDGPSGFNAVVGSFKAKTGIGVDAIHPSMWSRISVKGKQLYTDLLNDVERTLTWPAQIQTLIHVLVPKTPTAE